MSRPGDIDECDPAYEREPESGDGNVLFDASELAALFEDRNLLKNELCAVKADRDRLRVALRSANHIGRNRELAAKLRDRERRIKLAHRMVADSLERPDEDGESSIGALELLDLRKPLKRSRR